MATNIWAFLIKNQRKKKPNTKHTFAGYLMLKFLRSIRQNAMSWLILLSGFLIYRVTYSQIVYDVACKLSLELKQEIHSHQDVVTKIIKETTKGSYTGKFYNDLTYFTDKFGPRKTGTKALELSIKHLSKRLKAFELVTKTEEVSVPVWLRGKEIAYTVFQGRKIKLRIKALGGSPSGKVSGSLMIVKDIEELDMRRDEVPGKIVLFNSEFDNYANTVTSRVDGPPKAGSYYAVGALVRSITPFSIGNIHVGLTDFGNETQIPCAAISLEDADKLQRMLQNNEVKVQMKIENKAETGERLSRNLIVDLPGKTHRDSYMAVSGHIDSWDVGVGALDNAGGALLATHVLLLLKFLKLEPPARTIRAILWTGEEMGLYGARAYAKAHRDELKKWTAAFESDTGLFDPKGFKFVGNYEAFCILQEIVSMFADLNTTEVKKSSAFSFTDLKVFQEFKIPLMEPLMKPNNYYWFQHTQGDSMRVMNSTLMDRHLALITGTAYVLANLTKPLPRFNDEGPDGFQFRSKKLRKSHRKP